MFSYFNGIAEDVCLNINSEISGFSKWHDLFWLLIPCLGLEIFCFLIERRVQKWKDTLNSLGQSVVPIAFAAKEASKVLRQSALNFQNNS